MVSETPSIFNDFTGSHNRCTIPAFVMIHEKMRSVTKYIFDQPFFYEKVRAFLIGGHPFRKTLDLLDAQSTEVILDVGCGPGHMAEKIRFKNYIGFDNDPRSIEVALRRKVSNAVFTQQDIADYDFGQVKPEKAILSGVLHHLSDSDALYVLKILARTVSKWIVTDDPIRARYHFVNNILCSLDRGEHIRSESEMLKLFNEAGLVVDRKLLFYSNTRVSKHIAFRLLPGENHGKILQNTAARRGQDR